MKDRIKAIMESKHMTQKVFAQFTGINEGTLSLLLRDKTQPTLKIYDAIHKHFPDISMEWLFDGVGSMYRNEGTSTPTSGATSSSADGSVSADGGAFSSGGNQSGAGSPTSPSLFASDGSMSPSSASAVGNNKGVPIIKYIDKPQRKITEIRVFFDDQTWESFVPKNE